MRIKYAIRNTQYTIILLIVAFSLSACSDFTGRISKIPFDSKMSDDLFEAHNLLSMLENKNYKLKTFKGTGKITFWKKNKKGLIAGAAWVGSEPDSFRIVIRNASGQPIASFANDGKWLYLVSHAKQSFYKKKSANSTLKKFISISVKPYDIVSILSGRIPINKHNSATIIKNELENGYVLVLKKRRGNVIEKIYLDESKKDVYKIEVFDTSGSLLYRTVFDGMQNINGYRVPLRLIFSNSDGNSFQLDIHRYWSDISVSPSMFVLTPP